MESTTWKALDHELRTELEALLQSPTDAYLSDFKDALGWWLLIALACALGAGVSIWSLATEMAVGEYVAMLATDPVMVLTAMPSLLGLPVAVIVAVWVGITCVRNIGRRGFAALTNAIVVVRGPKLKLLRYDDIAGTEQRVIGKRGQRFTVLTLQLRNGKTEELSVHGTWVKEVLKRLDPTA